MFVYTRAYFKKLVDDVKTVEYLFDTLSPLIYIAYLIYAICVNVGYIWANITLLALTVSYLIFYFVTYDSKEKSFRSKKKNIKHIYKGIKLTVTGMTLGITIYGIYVASTHTTVISILLSCFMALFWLFQVVIELLTYVLEYQTSLFLAALEADKDELMKPITAVGNFVKKVRGKEIEEPKEPNKILRALEDRVQKIRESRHGGFIVKILKRNKKESQTNVTEATPLTEKSNTENESNEILK